MAASLAAPDAYSGETKQRNTKQTNSDSGVKLQQEQLRVSTSNNSEYEPGTQSCQ